MNGARSGEVAIALPGSGASLSGVLTIPAGARGLVMFAHGSGSSRRSPRNRFVAAELNQLGLATFLFDLLTAAEERLDERTRELRFDIPLLAERLTAALDWAAPNEETGELAIGLFGASTGAAAALVAAAAHPDRVRAVVSRGGRPDLAPEALPRVTAPTLLIVGGLDAAVLALNERAQQRLGGASGLAVVPGATHLFEEPGALQEVARLAGGWFRTHLHSSG